MATSDVIIIGGGVIGLSTAYHLAQMGARRIILIEKDRLGEGSSLRAAGIGTHLIWSEAGIRARLRAFKLYEQFSDEWDDYTFHSEHGCLNLYTPNDWLTRASLLPLYDRMQIPYEILDAHEIHSRWPMLCPPDEFVGLFDPHGGYSEPEEYVAAIGKRVRELGVTVIEGEAVRGFEQDGDRVTGVRTASQTYYAGATVSTVHAWTLPLWQELGIQMPIKHFVHQRYVSEAQPAPFVAPPVNADPYLGYLRPASGNRILMGIETTNREEFRVMSLDFKMSELKAPPEIAPEGRDRFKEFAPVIANVHWETEMVGLISFACDGEPVLGPAPETPGLFVATAFHSGGFTYNSVAGELMAELVLTGESHIDVAPFSPSRFNEEMIEAYLEETLPQSQAVRRRH